RDRFAIPTWQEWLRLHVAFLDRDRQLAQQGRQAAEEEHDHRLLSRMMEVFLNVRVLPGAALDEIEHTAPRGDAHHEREPADKGTSTCFRCGARGLAHDIPPWIVRYPYHRPTTGRIITLLRIVSMDYDE